MEYLKKKVELIISSDGSHTLFLPDIDETYHSTHGAIQEAQHVFIRNGIQHYIDQNPTSKVINLLEVGMGTGLNIFLTLLLASDHPNILFNIHTIEAFPLEWDLVSQLNYCNELQVSTELFEKIHNQEWGSEIKILPNVNLTKEHVLLSQFSPTNLFGIVFFDAFAPNRQPDMWTIHQLEKVVKLLEKEGELITYCANGQFKRNLKTLKMEVVSLQGPPGKREITRGIKL